MSETVALQAGQPSNQTELVIGFVGAIGTQMSLVLDAVRDRLASFGYTSETIKVSNDTIAELLPSGSLDGLSHFERTWRLMTAGNDAREGAQDGGILAHGVAARIHGQRQRGPARISGGPDEPLPTFHTAYLVDSLKHPDEVHTLRSIYEHGFYLIGVYDSPERRRSRLSDTRQYTPDEVRLAIERDENEDNKWGQQTRDTFHLADFFVSLADRRVDEGDEIQRFLEILFGNPKQTARFDEYAMFLAFAAALRSGDIARQVGAVLVDGKRDILSLGANDVPAPDGGLYHPDSKGGDHRDTVPELPPEADDLDREIRCPNERERERIIRDIVKRIDVAAILGCFGNEARAQVSDPKAAEPAVLELIDTAIRESRFKDGQEFGRSVHAEMEALISCARRGTPARGGTLYCTTFPCHNCAKHIVDAGLEKVVYVEPYPKSKALVLHYDAIQLGETVADQGGDPDRNVKKVRFVPFVGVGPRRFLDLFSLSLGSGRRIERKTKRGRDVEWSMMGQAPRIQMQPRSYLDNEVYSLELFEDAKEKTNGAD